MFAVIYRGYVKEGHEEEYKKCWKTVASYFAKERGALGSTLHRTVEGMWVAYSRWPDKETRDRSWPQGKEAANNELPVSVQEAILGLKACLDDANPLSEICMEIVEEVSLK